MEATEIQIDNQVLLNQDVELQLSASWKSSLTLLIKQYCSDLVSGVQGLVNWVLRSVIENEPSGHMSFLLQHLP